MKQLKPIKIKKTGWRHQIKHDMRRCNGNWFCGDSPVESTSCVTCSPPSGAGVVLGGPGLTGCWFHHAPFGWGLSLSLHFFGKVSLPYHSYIFRRNRALDEVERCNNKHRVMLSHVKL